MLVVILKVILKGLNELGTFFDIDKLILVLFTVVELLMDCCVRGGIANLDELILPIIFVKYDGLADMGGRDKDICCNGVLRWLSLSR